MDDQLERIKIDMPGILKSMMEFLPVGYAFLVLIGYLDYYFFYENFGIRISSYLTTSEMVFSFLDLIQPILIFASIIFIENVAIWLILGSKSKDPDQVKNTLSRKLLINLFSSQTTLWNILTFHDDDDFENTSAFDKIYAYGLFVIVLILSIGINLYLIAFLIVLFHYDEALLGMNSSRIFALAILWLTFIFFKLYLNKRKYKVDRGLIMGFLTLSLGIYLLRAVNHKGAEMIMSGNSETEFEIRSELSLFNRQNSFEFIGETSEYIFLLDKSSNESLAINRSQVLEFRRKVK